VLDREFSDAGLLQAAEKEGVKDVVRLNLGTRPTLTDAEGNQLALPLKRGKRVVYRGGSYTGKVQGNWPEQALAIYQARMKLDESFCDLKSLLGLEKIMNKKREQLEKRLALGSGCWSGRPCERRCIGGKKHPRSSGLFILLKHRLKLSWEALIVLLRHVWEQCRQIVHGNVRTPV